uniref:Uncharacterized protein n=1 Tax=Rhizophora mucronata TaxID=61149 RepID=A0A2P2N1P2_RHIMU
MVTCLWAFDVGKCNKIENWKPLLQFYPFLG